jgi:hypothetical protein
MFTPRLPHILFAILALAVHPRPDAARGSDPVVPGTGVKIASVGDDFEDVNWEFDYRSPKSSQELDDQPRLPPGEAKNQRWYEGIKRGHPDVVRRVPTPQGGLGGSQGALLLHSMRTGIPGRITNRMQQDDLIADVNYRLGGAIPVSHCPNVIVRVFLPPVAEWEDRTGPQFAFRLAADTYRGGKTETIWPGMFIVFESQEVRSGRAQDYAYFRLRANRQGDDYRSQQIPQTGWWTLGLSLTPDGRIHYYASPGVDPLTSDDYLGSDTPYGTRCQSFKTFFFNVCNLDDGHTWSTQWIIDDPTVYYVPVETAAVPALPRR